ncbi:MAG: DUF1464 family protein [Caldisphaera sp.]|jgi:predicted butyrate kinase (DUF1464 family)|nr:MAG: DUF1464 domain-containing protein [Caldisphaera sp.]PMP92015.1 MAG: DUF1464 domain-containing protein [Caldisphaera sp.]
MVRAIGLDSGTMSLDILGFDDESNEVFLDIAIPREVITNHPEYPIKLIEKIKDVKAIVVSSGYGIPFKRAQESSIEEINRATFITKEDENKRLKIVGLRNLMKLFRESNLPAYFVPGVIQLETIPEYRKLNKIDLGTSDKIFSVAQALKDEMDIYQKRPSFSNFILVEIGFAYIAALSIINGKIVDGIGGTTGFPGFKGSGFIDAEVSYAISSAEPRFSKIRLFQGGISDLINNDNIDYFESLVKAGNEIGLVGINAIIESILKDIAIMLVSNPKPEKVYLSGRFTRYKTIFSYIKKSIRDFLNNFPINAEITTVSRLGNETKEAASGAAVLANGIANGRYRDIFETLEIRNSKHDIFSYIKPNDLKTKILKVF